MALPGMTWACAIAMLLASTASAQHQIVCSGEAAGGYAAFPDVCRLRNGDLYCVFYSGYGHVSTPNDKWPRGGRIMAVRSEFDPNPAAPPVALGMAKAVFTLGASSCTESYVMARTLAEGPKLFAFDALTCAALENFDLSVATADYLQPFPSVVIELPADYTRKRVVPFEEGSHAPDFVVVRHEPEAGCVLVTMPWPMTRGAMWSADEAAVVKD